LIFVLAIVSDLRNHRSVFFCPAFFCFGFTDKKRRTEKYDNNLQQADGLLDISGGGNVRDKRNSRLMETLAIGMIGAGIMGAICPKRHMRLWRFRLNAFHDFIDALADRPGTVRLIHVAEAGLGVWLALRNMR
jgi:hypothetical protein